jgi:hypothetical protein
MSRMRVRPRMADCWMTLEGRGLVESALLHQHLLGALDDLARLDLVVDV